MPGKQTREGAKFRWATDNSGLYTFRYTIGFELGKVPSGKFAPALGVKSTTHGFHQIQGALVAGSLWTSVFSWILETRTWKGRIFWIELFVEGLRAGGRAFGFHLRNILKNEQATELSVRVRSNTIVIKHPLSVMMLKNVKIKQTGKLVRKVRI